VNRVHRIDIGGRECLDLAEREAEKVLEETAAAIVQQKKSAA
jgi:hypothetical protein